MKNRPILLKIVYISSVVAVIFSIFCISISAAPSEYQNAYSYKLSDGTPVNLHTPVIKALLYPIGNEDGQIPANYFDAVQTYVNFMNYGHAQRGDYSTLSTGRVDNTNISYSVKGSFDRGRVYDNVQGLSAPFYGLMNDDNSFYVSYSDSSVPYDGLRLKQININDFYLYSSVYSSITIGALTSDYISALYSIEYFDNTLGDFVENVYNVTYIPTNGVYTIYLKDSITSSVMPDTSYFVKSLNITFDTPITIQYGDSMSNIDVRLACVTQDYYRDTTDEMFLQIKRTAYNNGFNDGSDYDSASWYQSLFDAVDAFLDWEFIPNLSFGIILTTILAVTLLIAFLKFFAGG